jgi:hypothetical protein
MLTGLALYVSFIVNLLDSKKRGINYAVDVGKFDLFRNTGLYLDNSNDSTKGESNQAVNGERLKIVSRRRSRVQIPSLALIFLLVPFSFKLSFYLKP